MLLSFVSVQCERKKKNGHVVEGCVQYVSCELWSIDRSDRGNVSGVTTAVH